VPVAAYDALFYHSLRGANIYWTDLDGDNGCRFVRGQPKFDFAAATEVKVPAGYSRHFASFDGKWRKLFEEGVGGPSWFTEFNVLTGLSVRSFGRFATMVTRIAAGHIYRGLPRTLSVCGYQTFSLYPFYGAFIGSREFQTTAGIAHYFDIHDLGTTEFEPDRRAVDLIARERNSGPLFLYVYTVANHFPWDKPLHPELTPDWRDLGNPPEVEEYIRRQSMSAQDYRKLLERLSREFPTDAFVIIRYGDHQPQLCRDCSSQHWKGLNLPNRWKVSLRATSRHTTRSML
jgi:hypothetical protein